MNHSPQQPTDSARRPALAVRPHSLPSTCNRRPAAAAALPALLLALALGAAPAAPAAQQPQAPPPAVAAPSIDQVLTLEAAGESFRDVTLARDGRRIAWVEAGRGADGRPTMYSTIYVADLAADGAAGTAAGGAAGAASRQAPPATAGAPRRIGGGGDTVTSDTPAWSPDGTHLAFLSDAPATAGSEASPAGGARRAARGTHTAGAGGSSGAAGEAPAPAGQKQIWIADLATGRAAPVTHLQGQLSALAWSPDDKSVAFLFIAGRAIPAGPVNAAPRDAGVVGEHPEEQRLETVDPATGTVHEVSPPDLFVYEYDWSPDGATFAATAAHGSGDDNWWVAELYTFARQGGGSTSLLKAAFQMANPCWSPDGRTIAFIGGLMSDRGVTGGDVYEIAASGGEARDLTPGRLASAAWLGWTAGGTLLAFEIVDGESGLARFEPGGRGAALVWRQGASFNAGGAPGLTVSRDGRTAAAVVSSFDRPPEVWVGPAAGIGSSPGLGLGTEPPQGLGWRQVTHRNDAVRPAWGMARSLHWRSDPPASGAASGATAGQTNRLVQGWLLAPPPGTADPAATAAAAAPAGEAAPAPATAHRYPLVVLVHGGPASSHKPSWPRLAGVLTSQGYYVLLPNPRGSYGFGEAFTRGNVKDFGYGDLRDILAGVDEAAAAAPIDPARVGIYGWSYGGYMVMWAVTQTGRFRAAVAGAGIVDWQSYYGQNGIDQWMIPYFGASVYDDPWIYERSSPITFIKAVHTPTLVLQGERDAEVPAPQAYEFWHALRTLGVETRLVIYPDQGHHLHPADLRDAVAQSVAWFRDHLGPAGGATTPGAAATGARP